MSNSKVDLLNSFDFKKYKVNDIIAKAINSKIPNLLLQKLLFIINTKIKFTIYFL